MVRGASIFSALLEPYIKEVTSHVETALMSVASIFRFEVSDNQEEISNASENERAR